MIRHLILFSLRFPIVVVALAAVMSAAGILQLRRARWDVFPEFAPPQVVVQTEAPGLSADEVEQLVARPVEAALAGVSRIQVLRSSSVPGLCVATAIFEEGTNVLVARQLVAERLAEARTALPDFTETPRLMPLTSSTSRLVMIGLTAGAGGAGDAGRDDERLRTFCDWTLRRRLQAVPGVAHVEVFGGSVKQYQIQFSPLRGQEYGVTLDEVVAAGRQATGFGGAGFIETANQRLSIRQRTRIEHPEDLAAAPVAVRDGVSLPLGKVADVKVAAADRVGSSTINGEPGILLVVHKQPDFNTLTVTASVRAALDELKEALPEGSTLHPLLFRQATFIERAIGNLSDSLLIGCVLVAAVLIAFLMNWRVLLISLAAIPLSLTGALLVLLGSGVSLNAMTLGGLAIALGEVVDDAIVDVENVLRRLHENALSSTPRSRFDIVLSASLEVRSAVVFASFIVMLVFLPVFFLDGLAGKLFGPLGLAYVVAILVSLVVALTVTPALCVLMLNESTSRSAAEPWLVRHTNRLYRWMLPFFLRRSRLVIGLSLLALAASAAGLPFLGGEFLPDFRESNFVIFMAGKPDSSLVESERVGKRLAADLLKIDGVRTVAQQIGRAELSEDTWGPNISEVWVALDDRADYDRTLGEVRDVLEGTPGYAFQAKQFLRERIDEVLTGSTSDLLVRIVGPDLDVLRGIARETASAMENVAGVVDLRVEQLVNVPLMELLLKPRDTARYGLSVGSVNQTVQTLLRGTQVGQVFEEDAVFDVVVRLPNELRDDPMKLRSIPLDAPTGHPVPLRAVADVQMAMAPNMVNREQGRRRLLVTCNAEGRDVETVMAEIRGKLASGVRLPSGYHFEFAGEFAAKAEAQQRLLWLGAASLVGIFLLLYLDFRSVRLSSLVMLSVPLACIGGVASVFGSGGALSLGSLVGFVTVFGIAVRNGILLVSNYQHLREGGEAFGSEMILKGSVERLAPILMTAATTALAILPLVVAGNLPGHEIEHPMAIVILGGLASSTLLTLFVLPTIYATFGAEE
ncbi:efflux RND transporter permease subunit [Planctomyces sp. SH-PL14]|uniref:efflux RND transporter permease subunit n=1 Tax=Planctomyces sp. SH-PL14 TaxID=1632864 RepID=UPI00078E5355|nr:efflux RND transporter permease subunit [Planctomyces sp. SH-PL14]AMV16476.1 Cobalt-zinc-cadmium resistance protein CzcA [Planctomyces sp. SH-PL14]